jgi:hypothetical protein
MDAGFFGVASYVERDVIPLLAQKPACEGWEIGAGWQPALHSRTQFFYLWLDPFLSAVSVVSAFFVVRIFEVGEGM